MNTFLNQKLLVVGGTSGVGFETAKIVAQGGGSVVVVGSNADKAEKARRELAQIAGDDKAFALTADLADFADVERLIGELNAKHSDIDLLVNSAGVFYPVNFIDHTRADYDKFLDFNRAMFFITQAVAKNLIAQNKKARL